MTEKASAYEVATVVDVARAQDAILVEKVLLKPDCIVGDPDIFRCPEVCAEYEDSDAGIHENSRSLWRALF